MQTKIIFAIIAVVGALALYLFDKETLAVGYIAIVWGVYERATKEKIKEAFKKTNNTTYSLWKERRK